MSNKPRDLMNLTQTLLFSSKKRGKQPGFTLVEVLTVLAIMTLLITLGTIGIGNINAGKGVTSAVATTESLFEQARSMAISKNANTRVLIDVDPRNGNEENYLRRLIVVHQEIDSEGEIVEDSWVQPNRAYLMPKGVYFSQTYSKPTGSFTLSGSKIKADFQGTYQYYEFNAEGIASLPSNQNSDSTDPRASFVVGTGVLRGSSKAPMTIPSAARDFSGFVTWRNGGTSLYRSPDQIPNLPNTPNFTF